MLQYNFTADQFRKLLEDIPIAIAMFDLSMNYLAYNRRWLKEYKLEERNLHGLNHYEVFPEISDDWKVIHQRCQAGEVLSSEMDCFVRTDGTKQWMRWEIRPWLDEKGSIGGIMIFTEDKTTQQNVQDELHEREHNYRILFESNPNPMWVYDLETLYFIEANNAAIQQYGYSKEEFLKMTIGDIRPAEELDKLMSNVRTESPKLSFSGDWRHMTKSGKLIDVEITSHALTYYNTKARLVMARDITQRKMAEEETLLLKSAVESSNISVSITTVDGNYIYVNPFFCSLTGYTSEEVIGENPRILSSGVHSVSFYANLWETILSGKDWEGEFQNKKKNGDIYWARARISPIVNKKGQITHFVAVKADITESKRMLKELVKAKNKAEESDRLKTAFLNNITHEIRTPLNSIIGLNSLLLNDTIDAGQRKEIYSLIEQSGNRLIAMVDDVVEMAKIVSGVVTPNLAIINPVSVLRELEFTTQNQCDLKGLTLNLVVPEQAEMLQLRTDEQLLKRILLILIENAVKFTDKGRIEFGCIHLKDHLQFFVSDTGCGIAPDKQKMVFDLFNQEHTSFTRGFEGNGLGLSIARGFLQILGSSFKLESEKNKGSTFSFILHCG